MMRATVGGFLPCVLTLVVCLAACSGGTGGTNEPLDGGAHDGSQADPDGASAPPPAHVDGGPSGNDAAPFMPVAGAATATGALMATYRCDAVGAYYVDTAKGQVTLQFTDATKNLVGSGNFATSARPEVKTYADADLGEQSTIALRNDAKQNWGASHAPGQSRGSYTLTLTTVSLRATAAGQEAYDLHGTLSAALAPYTETGASGNVTLTATF